MDRESLLEIIEKMKEEKRSTDVALSGYINAMLRAGRIEEIYQLLDKDNMIIILRSIVRQHIRNGRTCDLKLEEFDKIIKEKALENEVLMDIYREAIKKNLSDTVVIVCDLLHNKN